MTNCGISSYLIEYSKAVCSCLSIEYRDIIRERLESCAVYCIPVTASRQCDSIIRESVSGLDSLCDYHEWLVLYLDETIHICCFGDLVDKFKLKKQKASRARRERFLCRICRAIFRSLNGLRDHFNNCECEVLVINNTDECRNALLSRVFSRIPLLIMCENISGLETLFDKRFHFSSHKHLKDPDEPQFFNCSPWILDEISNIKDDLTSVESQLNDKKLTEWQKHTDSTDLSKLIVNFCWKLGSEVRTRPWSKLTEILWSFPVLDLQKFEEEVTVCCLCEAPGAFVSAINHFIKSQRPELEFDWLATSLNPYYEMMDVVNVAIDDDQFIRQEEVYGKWFFGTNNIGDILDLSFVREICQKFASKKADLITADGGISCIDDPEQQELRSLPFIFHELLVAINCLKEKGSFILKLFNLFSSNTCSILYLLCCLFEQVSLVKPSCSRAGNAEIYAVCTKFQNKSTLISNLTAKYFHLYSSAADIWNSFCLLPRDEIQGTFSFEFLHASRLFSEWQKHAILFNIQSFDEMKLYQNSKTYYNGLITHKKRALKKFLVICPIQKLDPSLKICETYYSQKRSLPLIKHITQRIGLKELAKIMTCTDHCFVERNKALKKRFDSLKQFIRHRSSLLSENEIFRTVLKLRMSLSHEKTASSLQLITGTKPKELTNSPFTDKYLLYAFNYFMTKSSNWNDLKSHIQKEGSNSQIFELPVEVQNYKIYCSSRHLIESFKNSFRTYEFLIASLEDLSEFQADEKQRRLIVIDPLLQQRSLFFPFTMKNENFNIYHAEATVSCELISQVLKILPIINPTDILFLHIGTALTRLTAGLLFILTHLFAKIDVDPFFTSTDKIPILSGQIWSLSNLNTMHGTEFSKDLTSILTHYLHKISDGLSKDDLSTFPVEVVSMPSILANDEFFEILYSANSINICKKLMIMVEMNESPTD